MMCIPGMKNWRKNKMNMLESADLVSNNIYGKDFLELSKQLPKDWSKSLKNLSFEQKQIIKIIAGTVVWR